MVAELTRPIHSPLKAMETNEKRTESSGQPIQIGILLTLWFAVNSIESFWLWWDESMPGWDEANHLKASLYYLQALQDGQWHEFWKISNKYPPLTYIISALTQAIFGSGNDAALLINWGLNAILMASVYLIARRLFNKTVGFWSSAIVLIFPRLTFYRLAFLTDITLATFTILGFACLTYWTFAPKRSQQWLGALVFGASLGVALLSKQTSLFFLFFPLIASGGYYLWSRNWQRIVQLLASFLVAVSVCGSWYRTNWIYAFSSYSSGIVQASVNEGDPPIQTLAAWTYYLFDLPYAISWVWILLPALGMLLAALKYLPRVSTRYNLPLRQSLLWLGLYCLGSYLLFSLLRNKDSRYIIPYLPGFAILVGYGLSLWCNRWLLVPWAGFALAIVLWWNSLFPGANPSVILGVVPRPLEHPRLYPQPEIIDTVIQKAPYLKSNLGVIPNTFTLNYNNVGYFGALRGFQVTARELGKKVQSVRQDGRSFDWLIATSDTLPKDHANEDQIELGKRLATDPAFERLQTWNLPDGSDLYLYHRRQPLVTVTALPSPSPQSPPEPRSVLDLQVDLPPTAPIGVPIPVTYHWQGNWQSLENGLMLLTWYKTGEPDATDQFWIHDHKIGFGTLFAPHELSQAFQVTETTAMLAPATLSPGSYTLRAEYVNLETGESQQLSIPPIALDLVPDGPVLPSPELDWVSQLRYLAPLMNEGIEGLEQIFDQVGRLHQYMPVKDYLNQTQASVSLRVQEPSADSPIAPSMTQRSNWYLSKTLAYILQEDSSGAIDTLEDLVQLTPKNPYAYVYLAFVHLYNWHPKLARQALSPALDLAPDLPEVQLMDAVTGLFQGHLFQSIDQLKSLESQGIL